MTFKSEICITIDLEGKFISATRDNKEVTIIIPCTESSSGRSSELLHILYVTSWIMFAD